MNKITNAVAEYLALRSYIKDPDGTMVDSRLNTIIPRFRGKCCDSIRFPIHTSPSFSKDIHLRSLIHIANQYNVGTRDIIRAINDPTMLDAETIIAETHVEKKRILIQLYTIERLLNELKLDAIDKYVDKTGFIYELYEIKSANQRYLKFNHASLEGIVYVKPVPPGCYSALQGRAWICGIIEEGETTMKLSQMKLEQLIEALPKEVK